MQISAHMSLVREKVCPSGQPHSVCKEEGHQRIVNLPATCHIYVDRYDELARVLDAIILVT